MVKIVLLSYTKAKLDKASPAQDLYSPSPMFQKTKRYGESLKPSKIYILSAKHHLVPMTKKLAPYDLTLKDMSKEEKDKWGKIVASQMSKAGVNLKKDKFVFLAGSEYIKPLLPYIPEGNIEKPMEGKRMGERLQWLNNQVKEVILNLKKLIYEVYQSYRVLYI